MPLFGKKDEKSDEGEKAESYNVSEGPFAEVVKGLITYPEFKNTHLLAWNYPNTLKCMSVISGTDKVSAHQSCAICMMLLQQLIILQKQPKP